MRNHSPPLIVVLLSLFLLLFSATSEAGDRGHEVEKKLGLIRLSGSQQIPCVNLSDLEGNPISLEWIRGEVILVYFWSVFCVHCRKELEVLQQLHEEFADEGLRVVCISVDKGTKDHVLKAIIGKGCTFSVLVDDEGVLRKEFGIHVVPTFLICRGRNGLVLFKGFGPRKWMSSHWRAYMRSILSEDG